MQLLEDRCEIQDLLTRYAAAVDERDLAAYRDCFADDVEIVGFGEQPLVGADAWVRDVRQKLESFEATQHLLGPALIKIRGETASSRTDVQATHYLRGEKRVLTLWATYRTDYARLDGNWKITRHELVQRGRQTSVAD